MNEAQDVQVRATPSIGNSASTALGVANPLAGITSFIVPPLLSNPLGHMFSYGCHITGSWGDPSVRNLGAAPLRRHEGAPGGGLF